MIPDVIDFDWCELCQDWFDRDTTCLCASENGRFDSVVSSPFGDPQDEWGDR